MICKKCNNSNPDNVKKCLFCGEDIDLNQNESQTEVETLMIEPAEKINNKIIETLSTNVPVGSKKVEIEEKDTREEIISENINIIKLIILTFGIIIKPGTTLVDKTRKYNKVRTGLFIYLVFSSITFIVYMTTKIIQNCFIQKYSIVTGKYTPIFDIGQLHLIDYYSIAIEAAIVSYIILLLLILIYYIASFLTSKGLSLGRYFVVITFSLSPFLILTCAASPLISIINATIGSWVYLFGIFYSLIILICTLNDIITFKSTNQKIIYHSIILMIVFIIIYVLISIYAKNLISF